MMDPYGVLGVSPDATQAEIVHAYRRRLRDHHPDLHTQQPQPGSNEQLRRVLAAYAVLRDACRRTDSEPDHVTDRPEGRVRITVNHSNASADQAPLSAGPVHWQPPRSSR
jgi:curved DNA-binding protein CbpA